MEPLPSRIACARGFLTAPAAILLFDPGADAVGASMPVENEAEPSMSLPTVFDRLRLPVIGSPLFIISNPALVIGAVPRGGWNK